MTSTVALADEIAVALPELKLLINNRWVASESGRPLRRSILPPARRSARLPKLTLLTWNGRSARRARPSSMGRGAICARRSVDGFCTALPT